MNRRLSHKQSLPAIRSNQRITRYAQSLGLCLLLPCAIAAHAQGTLEDYKRADAFLPWNAAKLIFSGNVEPRFVNEGDAFLYRSVTSSGDTFILIDPAKQTRAPAFDHARLAQALQAAGGRHLDAQHLGLSTPELLNNGREITFVMETTSWRCDVVTYSCSKSAQRAPAEQELRSPDGRWIAYLEAGNVFVRSIMSGETVQLSTNAEEGYDYGRDDYTPAFQLEEGEESSKPAITAIWSPDSRRLFTHRTDHRRTKKTYVLQSVVPGGMRTVVHPYPYPLPGDTDLPTVEPVIFDVEKRKQIDVVAPPLLEPLISWRLPRGWWSKDSKKVYYIDMVRGYKTGYLVEADADTGASRRLIEEHSTTLVDHNVQLFAVIDNGKKVLWSSERDGWNHLYLYDGRTGKLLRQVTKGAWPVREIIHVDEKQGLIYFTASGREAGLDPYLRLLYCVRLNGSDLRLLTPEEADHQITMSPTGRFFVDVYSQVNTMPVAVLRRATDGHVVEQLERGDLHLLLDTGWQFPEPFSAKAADGKTDIYGVLFRPVAFQPGRKYPIIENIYSGPHSFTTPKHFPMDRREIGTFFTSQSIANLGFVVVVMDGRGQNYRGTAFRNHQYHNLGDAGLADRISAMKQLAERLPFLDTNRVGIFGYSAGGYAAARAMLSHPEFYKVAVASAGNHDHRMDKLSWNERWMGYPVGKHYGEQSNITNASKLQGKLLLTYGDIDTNVPPASTLKFVHALIAANKDFDLLVFPNRGHYLDEDPYFIRRRWDYFVQHLLGATPPPAYLVVKPDESAE